MRLQDILSMAREYLGLGIVLMVAVAVKRHIVGGGNSRLFSVHPPLLIMRYQC